DMTSAFERGLQKNLDQFERQFFWYHPLAERKDVRIVMLPRQPRRFFIPRQPAPHAMHFVRDHRLAISRATENNCTLAFATRDCFGGRTNKIGIIYGIGIMSAKISHVVTSTRQRVFYSFFIRKS